MSSYLASNDCVNLIATYWLFEVYPNFDNRTKLDLLEHRTWNRTLEQAKKINDDCKIKDSQVPDLLVEYLYLENKDALNVKYGDPTMWKGCENYNYKESKFAFETGINGTSKFLPTVSQDLAKVAAITKSFMSQCDCSEKFRRSLAWTICNDVLVNVLGKLVKRELNGNEWMFSADYDEVENIEKSDTKLVRIV
tara:strand:+ start:600 stop:1181 length:582 start_codon:yes stop_codon:yes gene_type:complete